MKIALINPPLILQKNDPHTGIIFMPFILAYLSSYLKKCNYGVQVIDALGGDPWKFSDYGGMQIQGFEFDQIIKLIHPDTKAVFVNFGGVVAYKPVIEIAKLIKRINPTILTVLVENSQAVTAFSLKHDADNLLNSGYDVLLTGDSEIAAEKVLENFSTKKGYPLMPGVLFRNSEGSINTNNSFYINKQLDELPFPDWESFPIENYWSLKYAHGPMEGNYLPLLTSRGCPLSCRFCIVPSTNDQKWRARSEKNVVDEMEYLQKKFGVSEFHFEDLNPTVNNNRMVRFCEEIINRNLKFNWKIVAGTKIDTMKLETIPMLAKAGCSFIAFAPETGSQELLKKMNKKFNHDFALKLVKSMSKNGIVGQAVFVLGFPGETKNDIKQTARYIRRLVFAGVDEVAQYIVSPIPGSDIFKEISGYKNFSELTFSPTWRSDYKKLNRRRKTQYIKFFFWKALVSPQKLLDNLLRVFTAKFKTKMEQALYRVTIWHFYKWKRQSARN
jgi:radical SAM superfamily enzyme YgiQ (UPF0313 family)